ncbi:MAG: glycosyltransferase, partial [Pseudomonadota bacterium]
MRILFLHNNYPAQFGAIGHYLAAEGWDVRFMTQRSGTKSDVIDVTVYRDRKPPKEYHVGHPVLQSTGKAVVTGLSAMEVALHLRKSQNYIPDVMVAHSGWGPGLFLKEAWPETPQVGYFEWYYKGEADDVVFMRGPNRPPLEKARERIRNASIMSELISCDVGLVPTGYQASQFPDIFRPKLRVMHDGVDTESYKPADPGEVTFGEDTFRKGEEILTYVARGMEPYRGFPEFMDALELVQKRRPKLRTIIVGEDRAAYGKALDSGKTYKEDALDRLDLDLSRITFTGLLPRNQYRQVIQLSSVHVYFTVPFVLSWSMMEALSTGCLMLASDTAPVRELITDGENGYLTDYRNKEQLADDL